MRIVSGLHRGRPLQSPPGRQTRPTSDRARESLFNVLAHARWLDADAVAEAFVLDAFAGTGALGFEALSRGAADAVFFETDPAALAACRANAATLREGPRSAILKADALNPPPRNASLAPRTLVFLDPPYGKGWGAAALLGLSAADWLAPRALCVLEMSKKAPEDPPSGFALLDERRYGIALVRFLRRE